MSVIRVENLSKEYVIGSKENRRDSFREMLADSLLAPVRRLRRLGGNAPEHERFWALKDVSFEVEQGEVVGIIGKNGAGKSTLLKILSEVTEPTAGRVELEGRIGSLLEVGTGFHPELTGRENIFLNGAILGMSRAEIRRKFDDIVAFAETEKFIDTPVKHYSSGMYVRLAFAVAAHLEPEILIVDEVLSVGDIQFQKRCMEKMDEVASAGKTILLVSHSMPTILSLSRRCLLLSDGTLARDGATAEVVNLYQGSADHEIMGRNDLSEAERYGTGDARFLSIRMGQRSGEREDLPFPVTGCDLEFDLRIHAVSRIVAATVALTIYDEIGTRLIDANTLIKGSSLSLEEGGESLVRFLLKNVRLKPGVYTVGLWLGIINDRDIDGVRHATAFRMEARREDVLYTPPFPGAYACAFDCDLRPLGRG